MTVLSGESVVLRPVLAADAARLAEIGAEPEVARWWPGLTVGYFTAKAEGHDGVDAFAIEAGGELIGMAHSHEESSPEYRHAGIDIFLTSVRHGQGLGSDAVLTLARWLVRERGHHRVTIDPALGNARAIRAYERVGFRRVGVMRRHWRGPDGTWQDVLLMDALAEEL